MTNKTEKNPPSEREVINADLTVTIRKAANGYTVRTGGDLFIYESLPDVYDHVSRYFANLAGE